jgi:hypothetical protein
MRVAENVEESLQNIFGVANAEKQCKKYVKCVVEKHCHNHIFHVFLN